MRVMIFGTFDLLHDGHRFVIGEARKRGNVTAVVARDENVKRIKNISPTQTEQERMQAIEQEFPDIQVVRGHSDDFFAIVREHVPELILLGYDQTLPPDITEDMFPCPVERLPAFHPERFKSSLARNSQKS